MPRRTRSGGNITITSRAVCNKHVRHAAGEHLARTISVNVASMGCSCFRASQRPPLRLVGTLRRRAEERRRQGAPRRTPFNRRVSCFSSLARGQPRRRPWFRRTVVLFEAMGAYEGQLCERMPTKCCLIEADGEQAGQHTMVGSKLHTTAQSVKRCLSSLSL